MRVSNELNKLSDIWFFVGTGNGTDEFYILKAIAEKYNGKLTLWFPKSPPMGKKTGLAVLDSINTIVNKYPKICNFLFLIDREYIGQDMRKKNRDRLNNDYIKKMIEKQLLNNHLQIHEIDNNTPNGTFIIKGKLGSHILQIYIIVNGIDLKIEEEISKLIELEKGIIILPEKNKIKRFFEETFHTRSIGKGTGKLIEISNKSNLRMSFSGLTFVLNKIENQFSENN